MKLKAKSKLPLHLQPAKKIKEFQHEHPLTPLEPAKWYGTQRDPVVRHESRDAGYLAELRMDADPAWDRADIPLADYECPHGKLPSDNNITCGCWGWPLYSMEADLRERIRGLSRSEAIAVLIAA